MNPKIRIKKILNISNLSIGYKEPLVKDINVSLRQGDIALLIGENGVGKTTLLNTIIQLIPKISGSIDIDTKELNHENISKKISIVFSNSNIQSELTVYELLKLGRFPYKKWYEKITSNEVKWIDEVIDFIELNRYKNYKLKELSDGNLQKVCIARAIVQDTDFIILDEPTTHLDLHNKLMVFNLLKRLSKEFNKGILITSHDFEYAFKIADYLWSFKNNIFDFGKVEDLALKLNLYDSTNNYHYNYNENTFVFENEHSPKINISLEIKDEKVNFWLKHALLKKNYFIKKDSKLKIKWKDNSFYIFKNSLEINQVHTINDTLEKLDRM